MTELVHTANTPFDLKDWEQRTDIVSVSAGRSCAAAVLRDGTVLLKTCPEEDERDSVLNQARLRNDPETHLLSPTGGRRPIRQISFSSFFRRIGVGLRDDGTCVVFRDPPGARKGGTPVPHSIIERYTDLTEVAVSDAFFGVDGAGNVQHRSLFGQDDYRKVAEWRNVAHVVTGIQNAVFGITRDGRVLCAGGNCRGALPEKLAAERDVVDLCVTGAEAENVFLLHGDGTVSSLFRSSLPDEAGEHRFVKLFGNYHHTAAGLTDEGGLVLLSSVFDEADRQRIAGWKSVRSFAMGQERYARPFAIAVLQ